MPRPRRSSSPTVACSRRPTSLSPAASRGASSSTHWPRSRTIGAFAAASSASSSHSTPGHRPRGRSETRRARRSRAWRRRRRPVPAGPGVDAVSRRPSREDGLVHQPGSWTPNPAVPSLGAAVLRNRWASSVSNARCAGRAVRSARSSSGYRRAALPSSARKVSCGASTLRASARSLPRERQTASASTTRLGSSEDCSPSFTCHSPSSSIGSTSRKQARTGPATASRCHCASASESAVTPAWSAANTRSMPVSALNQARVTGSPARPSARRDRPSAARAAASTRQSRASAQRSRPVSGSAANRPGGADTASVRAHAASPAVSTGLHTARGSSTMTPGSSRPRATRSTAKRLSSERCVSDVPHTAPSVSASLSTASARSASNSSTGTCHWPEDTAPSAASG